MAIALSVNLNKIALLRNSREGDYPNPVDFGRRCLDLGANGITVHPRPDGRHIRPEDVYVLRKLVSNYPRTEFNIEGNPFAKAQGRYPGLMTLVEETRPHQCTLVPDSDNQITSDHGFDLTQNRLAVAEIIFRLKSIKVRSSLFMDPNIEQIEIGAAIGGDRIELYTGPYATAYQTYQDQPQQLQKLVDSYISAAQKAHSLGLGLNAGHDLNLENLQMFKRVPFLQEVSIGHAFTVDSLIMGMDKALKAYLAACQ
jgi:pyridoxine 5-phosphate synthase